LHRRGVSPATFPAVPNRIRDGRACPADKPDRHAQSTKSLDPGFSPPHRPSPPTPPLVTDDAMASTRTCPKRDALFEACGGASSSQTPPPPAGKEYGISCASAWPRRFEESPRRRAKRFVGSSPALAVARAARVCTVPLTTIRILGELEKKFDTQWRRTPTIVKARAMRGWSFDALG